jgi:Peptidase family M28
MSKPNLPTYPPPDKRRRHRGELDPIEFDQDLLKKARQTKINAELKKALAAADEQNLIAWLKALTDFKTRHTLSPLNVETAIWLMAEFNKLGYQDAAFHDFVCDSKTRHNVVATKLGKTEPDAFIIVCAHYDSRMERINDHTSPAPGADDNASGVITVLEAARLMQQVETGCSVRFILFSGEEQGYLGSTAYADAAQSSGLKIRLVVNLDMVGHPVDPADPTIIVERDRGLPHGNDAASLMYGQQLAAAAGSKMKTKAGWIVDSDYVHFQECDYVCVGLYDGADNQPFYHTSNDTPDKVNTGFCVEIVKMLTTFVQQASK